MAKKRKPYEEEELTGPAPQPEGLLKRAGRGVIGGLSAAANILDVPGSMVRDVIGGKNPLDQLLTPHRADNRLTGRDLARQAGLAGRKDTWGNWGGGLAVEIATDPLTYLTLGGSALGKFGRVAKAAGVHGDTAAGIYAKAMKAAPGAYGKRQARVGLTGNMIKQADPAAFKKLQETASRMGYDLSSNMDEAMGGMARFWPTDTVLGAGKMGKKMAGFMDDVGNVVTNWKIPGTDVRPVGDVANLFNNRTLGAKNRGLAQLAGKVTDDRTAARAAVRQVAARAVHERQKLGVSVPQWQEWIEYPQNAPANVRPIIDEVISKYSNLPAEAKEWGGVLNDVNEQIKFAKGDHLHAPRAFTEGLSRSKAGSPRPFSGFMESSLGRWDWTKSAIGGTPVLREMAKHVRDLRKAGITKVDDIATELESKFGMNFHPTFATSKQYRALKKNQKLSKQILDIQGLENFIAQKTAANPSLKGVKIGGVKMDLKDTFKEAAKKLGKMSDEALDSGVWGNDPLHDFQKRIAPAAEAISTVKNVVTHLADNYKANKAAFAPSPGSVKLGELLAGNPHKKIKGLSMTAGDRTGGAAKKFWELTEGIDISALKKKDARKKIQQFRNLHVDADTAKFFRQLNTEFSSPEAVNGMVKLYDSLTHFTKGLFTTADFLRFNARNVAGGMFNNAVAGQLSAEAVAAARDIATKGVITGATEVPIVKQVFEDRSWREVLPGEVLQPGAKVKLNVTTGKSMVFDPKSQLDDKLASQILSELAYAYEVTGHAGTGNPSHVQHAGGTLNDLASEIPGQKPFSIKGLGETLKGRPGEWNPKNWRVRGVGGAQETTMPWMRAGEQVGDFSEHMIRFPGFYALLKQGMDPAEAARLVGEAAVNYQSRHYTKFEQQAMQRLFLFYKFTKSQIPFTLKNLSENPGGKLSNVLRAVNRSRDEEDNIPDWIKETTSIPADDFLGGPLEDGTKRYVTGLGLPFEDPVQFASPSGQNLMLEAASRLNPMLKAPVEWMTGQSFHQKGGPHGGRPLDDMDPPLGRTLANIGQITGLRDSKDPVRFLGSGPLEHLLANSPVSSLLTKVRTATDTRKSIPAKASNLLTGLKISDVSPAAQDRELRNRVQRIERQLGARQFTETYLPKDIREKMSPAEAAQAAQLAALKRLLDERSKKRRVEK